MKSEKQVSISLRAYAKMCSCTHRTVSKAIAAGNIKEGWDEINKKIIPEIADKEWGINFKASRLVQASKEVYKTKTENMVSNERLDELSGVPIHDIIISPEDPPVEADRKLTLIKAQRELLKLKTESGELVNKESVYKELYELGKEVRISLQSIPDRIIDNIIVMDRNEAHQLLLNSINDVLEKIDNI